MSLACIFCKLLERIILSNVSPILEIILCLKPHWFQKSLSYTTQFVTTCNEIMDVADKEISVHADDLDFSKAFDKVPHIFLINKLCCIGL